MATIRDLVEATLNELSVKKLQAYKDAGGKTERGVRLATNKIRKANNAKDFHDERGYLTKNGPNVAASKPKKAPRRKKQAMRVWD